MSPQQRSQRRILSAAVSFLEQLSAVRRRHCTPRVTLQQHASAAAAAAATAAEAAETEAAIAAAEAAAIAAAEAAATAAATAANPINPSKP